MKTLKVCLSIALLLSTIGIGMISMAFTPSASALPPSCNCNLPRWDYGRLDGSDCVEAACVVD